MHAWKWIVSGVAVLAAIACLILVINPFDTTPPYDTSTVYTMPSDVEITTTTVFHEKDLNALSRASAEYTAILDAAPQTAVWALFDYTGDFVPELFVTADGLTTVYSWTGEKISRLIKEQPMGELYKATEVSFYVVSMYTDEAGNHSSIVKYKYDTDTYGKPATMTSAILTGFEDTHPEDEDKSEYYDSAGGKFLKSGYDRAWNKLLRDKIKVVSYAQNDRCPLVAMTVQTGAPEPADAAVYQIACCLTDGVVGKTAFTKEQYLSEIPTHGAQFENSVPAPCPVCGQENTIHYHAVII